MVMEDSVTIAAASRDIASIGILARGVVDVDVDVGHARHGQGGRADAVDVDAQLLEVEAEVLDHVVGGGVADHGGAGVQRGGHQRVLGDGVAALGQHDRASGGRSSRSTVAW